ncbi:MAG: hypothetical protein DMF90_17580 [Acidobacteria bacterium]|nr:MAG: hypothetical protein DMF90_17580 [Acidobacteriota bacterium]
MTPENVGRLQPQWVFQTETLGRFETTSLLLDNVLYVTGATNHAWALDARTGKQIWRYRRELPANLTAYDHARCPPAGVRQADRQDPVGRHDGGLQSRIRCHHRAAGRQGQGDCRRRWGRVRMPMLPGCLRCPDRQAGLALLHGAGARRAWWGQLVRR